MAGLLDFLDTPDGQLGIGLLAAAGPSMSPMGFGQRLAQGIQYAKDQKKAAFDLSKEQMQMDLLKQQVAQATRKNGLVNDMLAKFSGSSTAPAQGIAGGASGAPGMQSASRSGMFGNVPAQALAADLAFNDGKNMGEWLYKQNVPDMQVANGVAYDKNSLRPGFMPGVHTSQTGQTSVVLPDGNGGLTVSAPQGALDTYAAYKRADAGIGSANELVTLNLPQGPVQVTKAQALQMAGGGQPAALQGNAGRGNGYAGGSPQAAVTGQREILLQELARAKDPADIAALQRELSRLPGGSPAAAPRGPGIPLMSEAEKARQVKQAEADVQPIEGRRNSIAQLNQVLGTIDQIATHPGLEGGTGLQGTIDPRNYIPGTTQKDFQVAASQLQGQAFLGAYNQLKGAGAITEVEGAKAEAALGRLSRAQTTEAYKSALQDFRKTIGSALDRAKLAMPQGQATEFPGDMSPNGKDNEVQSKFVNVGGKQLAARRASDGNFYVQKDGKWFQVKD